jgi:hypothetical protein
MYIKMNLQGFGGEQTGAQLGGLAPVCFNQRLAG